MKKNHPCGSDQMFVIRAGMDFKLRCLGCSREFMIPRNKIEKNILSQMLKAKDLDFKQKRRQEYRIEYLERLVKSL